MDFRRLRFFVRAVDLGSISRTAEALAITQPALSQQISSLEQELGTVLLRRSHLGVTPTEAGLVFYRHAQSLLHQFDIARKAVLSAGNALAGSVSVGLPTSIAVMLAVPLLVEMRRSFPGIALRVVEGLSGSLHEATVNGRIDLSVLFLAGATRGLTVCPVMVEDMFFVTVPAIDPFRGAAGDLALEQATRCPLVLPSTTHGMRILIERHCARLGLVPQIIAELDSLPALHGAVAAGVGSTIFSWAATRSPSLAPDAIIRSLAAPNFTRTVSVCRGDSTPSNEVLDTTQDVLLGLIRKLVGSGEWRGCRLLAAA